MPCAHIPWNSVQPYLTVLKKPDPLHSIGFSPQGALSGWSDFVYLIITLVTFDRLIPDKVLRLQLTRACLFSPCSDPTTCTGRWWLWLVSIPTSGSHRGACLRYGAVPVCLPCICRAWRTCWPCEIGPGISSSTWVLLITQSGESWSSRITPLLTDYSVDLICIAWIVIVFSQGMIQVYWLPQRTIELTPD